MTIRLTAIGLLFGLGLVSLAGVGCGPDQELGGTAVPNVRPNTQLTARPPDLLESLFVVSFNWSGFDPDGRIRGFQWKLSNDGSDGISVQDTLTIDPVTGATLNPWHFTAGTDTTLLVSADLDSFPRDPAGYNRSFQTHSFLVRAIDEDGGVDPTPAYVSFTATTLLPTVSVDGPVAVVGQQFPATLPPTVTFLYSGADPDFGLGLPTKVRFLWKRALLPGGLSYADSKVEVQDNMDYLVDLADSAWTPWQPFARLAENRRVQFENQAKLDEQGRQIFYLFAVQVQDTAGAVSIDRTYGLNVMHTSISETNPVLTVFETYLPIQRVAGENGVYNQDIASGQELNFSWGATADAYAGTIESYRYGWDIVDPNDQGDPGWAVPPGNTPQHRRAPTASFSSGVHTLTIETRDNSGQRSRIVYNLSVIQAPPPADQLPLLLVDDVFDQHSDAWWGRGGSPAYDNDIFRDTFYESVLDRSGGVANFNSHSDVIDTESDALSYRRVVGYRSVLWAGRGINNAYAVRQLAMYRNALDPAYYTDRYNWLAAYQAKIGNLLFCSTYAMNQFLPIPDSGWALPIVFQSHEGSDIGGIEDGYGVGLGRRTLPDGTIEWIGESRYPYVTWGISLIDQVSPSASSVIYGSAPIVQVRVGRKPTCVGVKGLTLDPDFMGRHMPAGAPFSPTIFTEQLIDHQDPSGYPPSYDNLTGGSYNWGEEEFYDERIVERATPWQRQVCENSPLPGQLCLEPMFHAVARFDWIKAQHARKPDTYTTATNQAINITDNSPAGIVIPVVATPTPGVKEHGLIDDLRVRVQLTHPVSISQFRIELVSPAGTVVVLKEAGTGSGTSLTGWYPTDFTPAEPLSGLVDAQVFGNWRLRVIDTVAGGTGRFLAWSLEAWYDDTWPADYYLADLRQLCGRYALTANNTSARTNGVVVGLLSYKTATEKPSQVGDVLWGFDPYRFDHAEMTEAIRWVLGEHFNLPMRP
jgi:subtilisin-like proprotein convertase family protein